MTGPTQSLTYSTLQKLEPEKAVAFFERTTRNLLDAELTVGIRHHVLLSILNVPRVAGTGHCDGKLAQEHLLESGPVPWTIQRASQFFDFARIVVSWITIDGVATVASLLIQPVAVADVADLLARTAVGPPRGRAPDLVGPETQDLVDMARRTLDARQDGTRLHATWCDGPFKTEMSGEVLLPQGESVSPQRRSTNGWNGRHSTGGRGRRGAPVAAGS